MTDSDKLLPIDLTDFEYYTYVDDTPDHPMVMILRIHLEGSVDITAFSASLQTAVDHHPLLRSVISRSGRKLSWEIAESHEPSLTVSRFDDDSPPLDCPVIRFELTKEAGARFELRVCPNRSVLIAYFHHACVDGVGAIRFMADVFAEYGNLKAADDTERPELTRPDPDVLALRGACPELSHEAGNGKPWKEWLRGPSRFLLGRNYKIIGRPDQRERKSSPANVRHTSVLPRATVRRLRKLATARQVSTNDICMMVYLQQLAQWTQQHPRARDLDLFRVLMPVSMRTADHDRISAANVLSYVFQPFYRRDCRNAEALLSTIHRRTTEMIHGNEGTVLLKLFGLVRRVPGLLRISKWLQPSFATAVLANVGDLKRIFANRFPMKKGRVVAGNVVIQRIDGIAPLRKNTNVAISFGAYGGELILNLRADPSAFSEAEAVEFLREVTERLTNIADSQTLIRETSDDRIPGSSERHLVVQGEPEMFSDDGALR